MSFARPFLLTADEAKLIEQNISSLRRNDKSGHAQEPIRRQEYDFVVTTNGSNVANSYFPPTQISNVQERNVHNNVRLQIVSALAMCDNNASAALYANLLVLETDKLRAPNGFGAQAMAKLGINEAAQYQFGMGVKKNSFPKTQNGNWNQGGQLNTLAAAANALSRPNANNAQNPNDPFSNGDLVDLALLYLSGRTNNDEGYRVLDSVTNQGNNIPWAKTIVNTWKVEGIMRAAKPVVHKEPHPTRHGEVIYVLGPKQPQNGQGANSGHFMELGRRPDIPTTLEGTVFWRKNVNPPENSISFFRAQKDGGLKEVWYSKHRTVEEEVNAALSENRPVYAIASSVPEWAKMVDYSTNLPLSQTRDVTPQAIRVPGLYVYNQDPTNPVQNPEVVPSMTYAELESKGGYYYPSVVEFGEDSDDYSDYNDYSNNYSDDYSDYSY